MKKHLLTGLIILLPIALTITIVVWLFEFLTDPFLGIVECWITSFETTRGSGLHNHDLFVVTISRLIIILFLVVLIFFLGFFARRFFFKSFLQLSERLFKRIPFIKTIYTIANDVTIAVFSQKEKAFKKTVLLPFPHAKSYTLGLVTGDVPPALQKAVEELDSCIFIPTAPHPVSGYVLLANKQQLIDVDVSTEEVFRFLISCGIAHPTEKDSQIDISEHSPPPT